jgi:hypothetical protein
MGLAVPLPGIVQVRMRMCFRVAYAGMDMPGGLPISVSVAEGDTEQCCVVDHIRHIHTTVKVDLARVCVRPPSTVLECSHMEPLYIVSRTYFTIRMIDQDYMGVEEMLSWRKRGACCEVDYECFKPNEGAKPLAPRARSAPPLALKLFHAGPMFVYRQVRNAQA